MADENSIESTEETPSASETFRLLDDYFDLDSDASPDEAFDLICMMAPEDWKALDEAWGIRPANWRESCAYILGHGPVDDSIGLLRRALFDEDLDVAVQAACSYCDQRLSHPNQVVLDPVVLKRLQAIVDETDGKHMEEVFEVLREVKSATVTKSPSIREKDSY